MSADSRLRALLARSVLKDVVELTILCAVLFGLSGRRDWPAAWFVALVFAGNLAVSAWWLVRRDPDLFKERLTTAANVPRWDRLIAQGNRIVLLIFLVTAALDARFGWSAVPAFISAVGAAILAVGIGVVWWCAAANHFLSARSRIQRDRGHTVVQDGPYRFVRHPLYATRILVIASVALTLGSWVALVPAVLNAVLLIVRTALEDRLLRTELTGYRDYAVHVPARLLPGVW